MHSKDSLEPPLRITGYFPPRQVQIIDFLPQSNIGNQWQQTVTTNWYKAGTRPPRLPVACL